MAIAREPFQYNRNIYILEDPVAYRKEVVHYLDLIRTTYTGRTLLKYIHMRPRRLLIMPYVPAKEKATGPVNAYASPDDTIKAHQKDWPIDGVRNIPGYGPLLLPAYFRGTGAGSPVTLKYHPATFRQLNANQGGIAPGSGPGETLYHEMVHAMRMMHGKMIEAPIPEDNGMDNFEEFCAVLASNMYRSERGFTQLRTNHHGYAAMKDHTDSAQYASFFSDQIEKWFNQQQSFCLEMATSAARFNPLKYAGTALGYAVTTSMALP